MVEVIQKVDQLYYLTNKCCSNNWIIKIGQSVRNFQPVESNDFYKSLATFQHVRSLTDCEVSVVRVLTPREFRTLPPVKFSLAEILVSGLRCTVSTHTRLSPRLSISLSPTRLSSIEHKRYKRGVWFIHERK